MNRIIINKKDTNHLKLIIDLFDQVEEVWMATAFLKMSGLKKYLLMHSMDKSISNRSS